jgi:hypothetical protein
VKTTILIKREDLRDGDVVRVVYPLHVDNRSHDKDYLALDFIAELSNPKTMVSHHDFGIGEIDGTVWTIPKIIAARTK